MSGANGVIGSTLPGGAAGAMDMFGDSAPSIANLGIQSAPLSVLAAQVKDKMTGPNSKFDPLTFGANLMLQGLQPQTPVPVPGGPQQQPSQAPQLQMPLQSQGTSPTSQAPSMQGSMLNQPFIQGQGGMNDIMKRLGLLGGMQ